MVGEGHLRHVVMEYHHWCHDDQVWPGSNPVVMFNYIPQLCSLEPAQLSPKVVGALATCQVTKCKQTKCPRCDVWPVFLERKNNAFQGSHTFTPEDVENWTRVCYKFARSLFEHVSL
jgi:hypothetical protein